MAGYVFDRRAKCSSVRLFVAGLCFVVASLGNKESKAVEEQQETVSSLFITTGQIIEIKCRFHFLLSASVHAF